MKIQILNKNEFEKFICTIDFPNFPQNKDIKK